MFETKMATAQNKLQKQIDNTFKAMAVMLPSPILNLGRVSGINQEINQNFFNFYLSAHFCKWRKY